MLEAILYRLTSDMALSALLGATEGDTHIEPLSGPFPGPFIAYEDSDVSRGGVNLSKLTLRIVAPGNELTVSIKERVIALLNVAEEETGWYHEGVNVLTCSLNGGGSFEMGAQDAAGVDVYERFLYFDVKWKETT